MCQRLNMKVWLVQPSMLDTSPGHRKQWFRSDIAHLHERCEAGGAYGGLTLTPVCTAASVPPLHCLSGLLLRELPWVPQTTGVLSFCCQDLPLNDFWVLFQIRHSVVHIRIRNKAIIELHGLYTTLCPQTKWIITYLLQNV